MPLLGAHQSIAGGYYKAVELAAALGMDVVQIFTKNNNQWKAKPLAQSDIDQFRSALKSTGVQFPCAHDSYLINLASPNRELWQRSLDAFTVELERAEALGLMGVVMHPGSFVDSSEEEGLARIISALDIAHRSTAGFRTLTLLETTAGQGNNLGHRFEQLAKIADHVERPERIGVCVDTCHIFVAGYAITTRKQYEATMDEFDRVIGLERIRAFHLNDSVRELGSRVDRHAKIGAGKLGKAPFRYLLNDPRFATVPMYLETPKGQENGESLDAINLRILRGLVKKSPQKRHGQIRRNDL
ncbi:MAG TPA: deoxyribonuclease IV [Planctomycetaceae bacterium]|nr:deoxyribonuclease IV [Planctomycetaceae bacterium]